MKKQLFFLLLAASLLCACKQTTPNPPDNPQDTTQVTPPDTAQVAAMRQPVPMSFNSAEEQLLYRTGEFTFNLTSLICQNPDKDNIILSPLSASLMLGMIMNGAVGETLAQMQRTLGFEGLQPAEINAWYKNLIESLPTLDTVSIVKIANAIWVQNDFPVLPEFVDVNKSFFNATAENVNMKDPATADQINQWAATNTNDLIKQVVTPENIYDCAMVLANALYFKSKWAEPFDASNTHRSDFDPLNGARIKPETMEGELYAPYASTPAGQLLELFYKDRRYCMDILLPDKDQDIRQVLADLTSSDWNAMLEQLNYNLVWLRLPKFKLKYDRALTDDLRAAGMPRALTPAAEFPHLSQVPTYLSWVKQACYLAVDEDGTEAAAVTIGGDYATGAEPEPMIEFFVNRPFFLVIRERQHGNILFTAMITNPEK